MKGGVGNHNHAALKLSRDEVKNCDSYFETMGGCSGAIYQTTAEYGDEVDSTRITVIFITTRAVAIFGQRKEIGIAARNVAHASS